MGLWIVKPKDVTKPKIKLPPVIEVQLSGFVDGKSLKQDDFDNVTFSNIYGRPATLGEMGCSVAHLRAYTYLANSDLDAMLVLEEDALQIREIDSWEEILPEPQDIGRPWIVILETRGRRRSKKPARKLSEVKMLPHTATAYIMSKKLAVEFTLAIRGRKAFWQADWPPSLSAKAYALIPEKDFFEHGDAGRITSRPVRSGPKALQAVRRVRRLLTDSAFSRKEKVEIAYHVFLREIIF